MKFRVNGREIPPDLAAGERFEIIAVVENDGDATAESFSVAFSIDNRRPLSSTVPSLGRGQSVNVPFTHTFAYEDLGTRVISLFADSTGGVTEKNERNNGREARVKVRQPQPVIGPMHTDRTSVRVGEKVRASITVTNRVNMPELTALLILRVPSGWSVTGRGADNKCVGQCTSIPYTIPTGKPEDIEITVTPNEPGQFTFEGIVQWYYDGRASDAQEIPVGEQPITVIPGEQSTTAPPVHGRPDLEVIALTVDGSHYPTVHVGKTVRISATVKNTGNGVADRSTLAFYSSDRKISGPITVDRLGPGESQEWSLQYIVQKNDGTGSSDYPRWLLRVVADSDFRIPEEDENNNTRSIGVGISEGGGGNGGGCPLPAEPSMRLSDLTAPMSALALIGFVLIRRRRR